MAPISNRGPEEIGGTTVFHDAPVHDPIDVHRGHFHGLARGSDALPLAQVGATHGEPSDDPLPFRDLLLDGQLQVRIRPAHAEDVLLSALDTDRMPLVVVQLDVIR